jgi:hypothetical protein
MVTAKIRLVKLWDESVVFCQADRCDEVARYLFVAEGALQVCRAYCELHSQARAREAQVALPPVKTASASACSSATG